MPFPDQLLEQAHHLANRERTKPRQASLRRAVSTAYYALFHLLTTEAAKNWKQPDQRHALARLFEHGRMKSASKKWSHENPPSRPASVVGSHLRVVAETFVQAQQQRHTADYDNAAQWTRTDVMRQIRAVDAAFQSWKIIRKAPPAQAYLVSLLGKDR
jgi:uncharacterized protein (UPF0332 family)